MTELRADLIRVPSWALGLVQEAVPGATLPGNLAESENLVPLPGGRMATRGGSRILLTLKDDAVNSAATPVFQAAGTALEGTGAVSPAWPTHQTDDIALLIVETSNEPVTLSTPAGFVEVADSPQSQGAGPPFQVGIRLTVFWARATSGAMATPTVADPGDHVRAQILTFRGCITAGNPWDVTAGDSSTQTASVNIPGDTTTVDRCLVVAMVGNTTDTTTPQTSGWTNGGLNNVTEIADGNTDLGFGGGFGVAVGEKALAGAYGVTTATLV